MNPSDQIPIVDLFAGPGGLGEGFSALLGPKGGRRFRILLSIEMESWAHQTLELRAFFRQFRGDAPSKYYEHLAGRTSREELFLAFPQESDAARAEAMKEELSEATAAAVHSRIALALRGSRNRDHWVLIGGPPCQAYSLMGRSRNRGIAGYSPEEDHRTRLYVEYLQILADHRPAIFVMENVKGLLSATLDSRNVFESILRDLAEPAEAIRREGRSLRSLGSVSYDLMPAVSPGEVPESGTGAHSPAEFVVRTEHFGIPQSRHRVIIVGVRSDLGLKFKPLRRGSAECDVRSAIAGLPRLRSGLSSHDSTEAWTLALRASRKSAWLAGIRRSCPDIAAKIESTLDGLAPPKAGRGGNFVPGGVVPFSHPDWFSDVRLGGVCNHSARGHIAEDLHRYLYAACFASTRGHSPALGDFPRDLLPAHRNALDGSRGGPFADRFRVQLKGRPATTITSHISKDGHYYIHYDPTQCRSLTVREAARLQSFPDNYLFCGPRTAQYIQVGNAVPPLMAHQIAGAIARTLRA